MIFKLSAPPLLFGSFIFFSYYGFSNSLHDTVLDDDFYQDLDLFSRFDSKSVKHKNKIETDTLNVRDYFFNNSFNLLWKSKNDTNKANEVTGDAFLLNVLLPDWIHEYSPEKKDYSPRSYYTGDDVVFLLGTSFSFVQKLFDNVSNWKSEVNDANSNIKLSDKSSNKDNNEFYLSHPWPIYSSSDHQFQQKHLYQLRNYQNSYVQMKQPFHFKIDNKNVEAVYAAVDLSVNHYLLNLDFSSRNKLQNNLLYIQRDNYNSISWQEDLEDVYGDKYKFAVDFAVLKVTFNISHLSKDFLDYISRLYHKTDRIPQILSSELEITNERTAPIYMAGWEPMTEHEIDLHTMENNLFVKATLKKDKDSTIATKTAREYATEEKFNEWCELKIYEMYGSSQSESQEYEIANKRYYPNSPDGILSVKYQIKKKSSNTLSKPNSILIPGFKKEQTKNAELIDIVNTALKKAHEADMELIDFLETKPRVHASWKEYEIKHSYFPFKSIQHSLFEKTLLTKTTGLNLLEPTNIFELNSNKYINIAHHLAIPNMMKNSKGNIAIMKHPYRSEKVMIGMYDGTSSWVNPISSKIRKVGKITMFISPWRYDLFNEKNNLSKPSLGDVLVKKKMHSRLVQTNRFRISTRAEELS